jgi:hypothetical protein
MNKLTLGGLLVSEENMIFCILSGFPNISLILLLSACQ